MRDAVIEAGLDRLLVAEGGFVDDPQDPGGATKYGVTVSSLSAYRGTRAFASDIENLTPQEAKALYRKDYIETYHLDSLPYEELFAIMLDAVVLHGGDAGVRILQRAINTPKSDLDGVIGLRTLSRIVLQTASAAYMCVLRERVRYMGEVIAHHPAGQRFASGWLNRLSGFVWPDPLARIS